MRRITFPLFLMVLLSCQNLQNRLTTQVCNLKCEYFVNPPGIDVLNPRLSWNIESAGRNWMQSAYQIIVTTDSMTITKNKGDFWNSGRVESSQSVNIEYTGPALSSHQIYWWKVRVWDSNGTVSGWSTPGRWTMGILTPEEWNARWIGSNLQLMKYQKFLRSFTDFGMEPETEIWEWAPKIREMTGKVDSAPAVHLRKIFEVQKEIKSALVSVCGLGLYELYINGARISNEYLNPAFSDYQKRVFYNTYNVTGNIETGQNAIGVLLGNGWYNLIIPHVLRYYAADYIAPPKLLLQLDITYSDGTTSSVISDETWKFSIDGPVQFNCLLGGETYNANKEMPNWDKTGFDDSGWANALPVDAPEGILKAQMVYPVRKIGTIAAVSIMQKADTIVVDFGKELTGWVKMNIKGKKNQEITIQYPGATSHTLGRYQTYKYIFKGEGKESFEPRFSYNGFQKIEITGLDYVPESEDFTAIMVNTDLPLVGKFSCSNDTINKLQNIILHTIRNYIVHIPNDPTREKAGWTQDIENAFDVTAFNFDCGSMYSKWQYDFLAIQHSNGYVPPVVPGRFDGQTINGPWWGGMIVYQPWQIYQYFADSRILEASYPAMKKYLDYLISISENNIVEWGLGDWLEPGSVRPVKTPVPLTSTIAFYYYATITGKTAQILGKPEEAKKYSELAGQIKHSYNQTFFDQTTGEYALGSQASQLLSLYLGLVPTQNEKIVKEALLRRISDDKMHLSTGFVATPFLLNGLSDLGYPEIAYTIATQNTYPSWFDMVFNHGNSVLKEQWDGGAVQMPSLGGSIGSWFYYSLAGIKNDPSEPGFKSIIIDPTYKTSLNWVKASFISIYGNIESSWKREKDLLTLNINIPANTHAKVYLPTIKIDDIKENNKPIAKSDDFKTIKVENGRIFILVGSGNYFFNVKLND